MTLNSEGRSQSRSKESYPRRDLREHRRGEETVDNPWSKQKKGLLKELFQGSREVGTGRGLCCSSRCPKYGSCFGPNFFTFSTPGTGRVGEGEVPRTGGCWLYALTTDGCTQEPGLSPLSLCSSQTQTGKTTK